LPEHIQTNEELCLHLKDVTPEWIISKTGIKRRFVAGPDDTASGLSVKAALQAILKAGLPVDEIGLIIAATFSPDYMFPPVSARIQKELKAVNAQIIDINTNCTGFVTAMTLAADRMQSDPDIKYSLVIGVELHTRYVDKSDKETAIFFSDGAAAAILGKQEAGSGILGSKFKTDASTYESVRFRGGGSNFPFTNRSFDPATDYIEMNGLATWKQAITNLPIVMKSVCSSVPIQVEEIDFFIFHQANLNLIQYVMAKLKLPSERTFTNVEEIGNTGSASVGIALSEAFDKGLIKPGSHLLLAGVGAGFNFGASIWRM
jgi:3-oxoacyl-[acyl-carrier-protein] synthase-3